MLYILLSTGTENNTEHKLVLVFQTKVHALLKSKERLLLLVFIWLLMNTRIQSLPFEVIDRSLSLINCLNTRQAIEFSIAYKLAHHHGKFRSSDATMRLVNSQPL